MKVGILGAGSWGTTLGLVLSGNKHEVTIWSYNKEQIEEILKTRKNFPYTEDVQIPTEIDFTNDLEKIVSENKIIVTAIPTQFLRSVLEKVSYLNFSEHLICNVSKGIEIGTLMTISEVIIDVLKTIKKENVAVLSGPSHAEEVWRKVPTTVVSSSYSIDTSKKIAELFSNSYFRVYTGEDIRGVELGGALKNVIAIGSGIIEGAGFGDNTKAAIITRGIIEMSRLGVQLGANEKTFNGLSGIGDLIVTCMSKFSRNRFVGEELGKGKKLENILNEMTMVAEGVPTTKAVEQISKNLKIEMPIFSEVYKILFENKNPIQSTKDLMTRELREEH